MYYIFIKKKGDIMTKFKKKTWIKRILVFGVMFCIIMVTAITCINSYVKSSGQDSILTDEKAAELTDVDCIIILGCGVKDDGVPSDMLNDRLLVGIELYKSDASERILMSGDHGREEYDEVNVMKQFAIDKGVTSEDVFMDHAGFSTYESMYRATNIFKAKKVIIVTQGYHLYRALYIAKKLGLEAYGVNSDLRNYAGQTYLDRREVLARNKDFFSAIFKPEPTYLGEEIPVSGNGDLTND
jgi:vancomycin permeability regulator SanA